jgi:uncharacterized Zn finger protein
LAKDDLASILTVEALREAAGEPSFSRGRDYFKSGQVGEIVSHEGVISARVLGTHTYKSKLFVSHGTLAYDCTCPAATEFGFCKHCVALGLAWLDRVMGSSSAAATSPSDPMATLRAYLLGLDKDALVKIVEDHAFDDDAFRQRLVRKADRAATKGLDLAYYRKLIKQAATVRDYIEYDEAGEFAEGIYEVATELRALIEDGHAAEAVDLAELAVESVERVLDDVEDGEGEVEGTVYELQEVHLEACIAARPDPVDLARRLFRLELGDSVAFANTATVYAEVLGDAGVAEFRRLLEAEWNKLPPLKPGDPRQYDHQQFHLSSMMESAARASGDVDALVAIKERHLTSANDYLQLAEILAQAGRDEESLEWGRKGIAAFGGTADRRLTAFVAGLLVKRGDTDAGIELLMDALRSSPSLESYHAVQHLAESAGVWPKVRDTARAILKETGDRRRDQSALVQALLNEGESGAAWELAVAGGCDNRLWMELADSRAESDPEDALAIYDAQLDDALLPASQDAYDRTAWLLKRIEPTMARLGRQAEFQSRVASIREEYKRRRNLLDTLNRAGFGGRRAA